MPREYEKMPADGIVAISPNAGYCKKGAEFEAFLASLFESRPYGNGVLTSRVEVKFIVGGLIHGLKQFDIEKQPAQIQPQQITDLQNEKKSKGSEKKFIIKNEQFPC